MAQRLAELQNPLYLNANLVYSEVLNDFHILEKRLDIPLCTHDKKILKNFSQHHQKVKFYERVYKPEEILGAEKMV